MANAIIKNFLKTLTNQIIPGKENDFLFYFH